MPVVRVTFKEILQDSQDLGSDNEHMVSRLFFDIDVDGERHEGLHADIKQPVGSDFETAALEVGRPAGYDGPLDYSKFREAAEECFRRQVGSRGSGIRVQDGASNIRMRNNRFGFRYVAEFEAHEP